MGCFTWDSGQGTELCPFSGSSTPVKTGDESREEFDFNLMVAAMIISLKSKAFERGTIFGLFFGKL